MTLTMLRFGLASLILVMAGLAGAYVVAAVPGGTFEQGIVQTFVYLATPWMLATEVLATGFLAYGYFFLTSTPWKSLNAGTIEGVLRRLRLRLLLVFALLVLILCTIGALFARELVRSAHEDTLVQLQTIVRLKAQQVDKWLYEHAVEAELGARALAELPLDQWSGNAELRQLGGVLVSELLAGHPDRIAVSLTAADGRVLAQLGDTAAIASNDGRRLDGPSRASGLQIVERQTGSGASSSLSLSFVVPLRRAASAELRVSSS